MSIVNAVFVKKSKLPTPAAWAAEIRAQGFELELPTDFDRETFSGFLPCQYRGARAGFEYSSELVADAELDEDARKRAKGREVMVSFVTHSDADGLATAIIASAVLAAMADGVHWDQEANEFQQGARCVAWAKELEASLRADRERPKPAPPPGPKPVDVQLRARVAFRGANLLMLETVETPPRRFTVRLPTAELPAADEVAVTALWEHAAGAPTVRSLAVGGAARSFDEKGVASVGGPDVAHLLAALGTSEAAMHGLMRAGEAAVPALTAFAADARAPLENRRVAIVILGQLRAKAALAQLEALAADAALGAFASRAVELIRRGA